MSTKSLRSLHLWVARAAVCLPLTLAGMAVLFAAGGCASTATSKADKLGGSVERDAGAPINLQARLTMAEIWKKIEASDLDGAQAQLTPLIGDRAYGPELGLLQREIDQRRAYPDVHRMQGISQRQQIHEVEGRQVLPDRYGQTRVIAPDSAPFELPPGPMEKLLNKRVNMNLVSADVATMVAELSKTEGMNIIADEALANTHPLTVKVTNVPLKELLSYISRNMGVAFNLGENVIWVTEAANPAGSNGPKSETRIIKLTSGYIPAGGGGDAGGGGGGVSAGSSGGSGDDLLTVLHDFLDGLPDTPPDAKFVIYRNRNILVIRNTIENVRAVEELIKQFDKAPLQVLIEARFLEMDQKTLFQLGNSISNISYGPGKNKAVYTGALPAYGNPVGGSPQLQLSGIISNVSYTGVLSALDQNSKARTLSSPRITVINNQTAHLRKGDKRYYFQEFSQQSTGGQTPQLSVVPSGSATELQLGITLQVHPSIGNDRKTILLNLDTAITNFIEMVQLSPEISMPHTNDNTLNTTVVVNSGETVVMGGLLTDSNTESDVGLPVLKDIPLVGYLFKKKEHNSNPTHLLIFVTATIIDPDGVLNTPGPTADTAGASTAAPVAGVAPALTPAPAAAPAAAN